MIGMDKENVYIIIPVHNRKAITLQCLNTLKNNGDLDQYHVVVVDSNYRSSRFFDLSLA